MFLLEGSTGVGKSTFLTLLGQRYPDITIVQEPKEHWLLEVNGESLLGNYYKNPHRWAYTIEIFAMIHRVSDHLREQNAPHPFRVLERSIYSGHYCFAILGHQQHFMSDIEWQAYEQWVDFFFTRRCMPPRGFIYLKADPEVCHKRVRSRAWKSETSLDLGYVTKLCDRHEMFLIKKEGIPDAIKKVPVLVIDANDDFIFDSTILNEKLEEAYLFIKETGCLTR